MEFVQIKSKKFVMIETMFYIEKRKYKKTPWNVKIF